MKKFDKRRAVYSIVAGLNFSLIFVCGFQLNKDHEIHFGLKTTAIIILFWLVLSALFYFVLNLRKSIKADKNFKLKRWQIFLPLFLLSLFLLFAIYPGNYCYDSGAQYRRYATGEYTTHYPPAFCFLLGVIIDFGVNVFGNANAGVVLACLFQSLIVNLAITETIFYLSNKIKNKKFTIINVTFFVVHPLVQILILSTCHDVVFGATFLLIVLELLKLSEDDLYLYKKSNWFKLFVYIFTMCIFRNNGFFALIPALIIGLIVLKKNRVRFATILLIPMLIFQIGYNIIFLGFINVKRESLIHESLNVPVMQIARALYYNHPTVWSDELNTYFHEVCDWRRYGEFPSISDGIKKCINDEYLESHLFEFVGY